VCVSVCLFVRMRGLCARDNSNHVALDTATVMMLHWTDTWIHLIVKLIERTLWNSTAPTTVTKCLCCTHTHTHTHLAHPSMTWGKHKAESIKQFKVPGNFQQSACSSFCCCCKGTLQLMIENVYCEGGLLYILYIFSRVSLLPNLANAIPYIWLSKIRHGAFWKADKCDESTRTQDKTPVYIHLTAKEPLSLTGRIFGI